MQPPRTLRLVKATTNLESDLDKLTANVYTDIQAICEKLEDVEDDVRTALNSLMEHSAGTGEGLDSLLRRMNALSVSYTGLLARCNAVEEQSKGRTRNLVKSIDATDKAIGRLEKGFAGYRDHCDNTINELAAHITQLEERYDRKIERLEAALRHETAMRASIASQLRAAIARRVFG